MTEEKQSYEVPEGVEEGILSAEDLALQVAGIVFNQGKAKIFNLLESQLGMQEPYSDAMYPKESQRLRAVKRMAQDIIKGIAKEVQEFVVSTLGRDWTMSLYYDPEDVLDANSKEYEEAEEEVISLQEALK